MSPLSLLSRFAHALNPRAREGLYALLPEGLTAGLGPPDGGEETLDWQENMLAALRQSADVEGDGDEPTPSEGSAAPSIGLIALGALLLSTATRPSQAAHFLNNLPLHLQGPVLHRLLTRSKLSCLRDLREEEGEWIDWLRKRLEAEEHWGVEQAAAIMRGSDQPRARRQLLESVAAIDRPSALVLQQHLYHFTDLLQLSDRDLQLVLASESTETLALALSGVEPAVRKEFYAHISKRRRVLIAEEAERYAEATADEVEQAQGAVLAIARLLYERRRITTYMGALKAAEPTREEEPSAADKEEEAPARKAKRGKRQGRRKRANPLAKLGLVSACAILFAAIYLLLPATTGSGRDGDGDKEASGAPGEDGPSSVVLLMEALGIESSQEGGAKPDSDDKKQGASDALVAVPGTQGVFAEGEYAVEEAVGTSAPDSTLRLVNLRVGRLQATVLEERFAVQTPLVRIHAPVGSVYSVRVVLDATTQVRVEKGLVEIQSIAGSGGSLWLQEGEERTFAAGKDW